jgi:hypothetical protein
LWHTGGAGAGHRPPTAVDTVREAVKDALAVLEGHRPAHPVNPEVLRR